MNRDRLEGKYKQLKGAVQVAWGRWTGNDWTVLRGQREQLVGVLEERYGVVKEDAERQAEAWYRMAVAAGKKVGPA